MKLSFQVTRNGGCFCSAVCWPARPPACSQRLGRASRGFSSSQQHKQCSLRPCCVVRDDVASSSGRDAPLPLPLRGKHAGASPAKRRILRNAERSAGAEQLPGDGAAGAVPAAAPAPLLAAAPLAAAADATGVVPDEAVWREELLHLQKLFNDHTRPWMKVRSRRMSCT